MAGKTMPILRGENFLKVSDWLNKADQSAANFTTGWVSNAKRWAADMTTAYNNRVAAMKLVAGELESQMPGWRGLGLTKRLRYEPWRPDLKGVTGRYDPNSGLLNMGENAFGSAATLVNTMVHEAFHRFQHINRGDNYMRDTAAMDAEAHLFSLENRHLTGASPERLRHHLGWFNKYCETSDRLSQGLPVDPINRDKYNITQPMSPVKRADLALRFSFIESDLRREGIVPNTSSIFWQKSVQPFVFQPWKKTGVYDANPFYGFDKPKQSFNPFKIPEKPFGSTSGGLFTGKGNPDNISPFSPKGFKGSVNPFFNTRTNWMKPDNPSDMGSGTLDSAMKRILSFQADSLNRSQPILNPLPGPSWGLQGSGAYNSPMAPGTGYSDIKTGISYRVDNFGWHVPVKNSFGL